MVTYYITKYALTKGVFSIPQGRETLYETTITGVPIVYLSYRPGDWGGFFLSPREYTTSIEEAQARVKKMIQRKIASLKKQLAKLEAIDVEKMPIQDWDSQKEGEDA
jgi:hypothetical protein